MGGRSRLRWVRERPSTETWRGRSAFAREVLTARLRHLISQGKRQDWAAWLVVDKRLRLIGALAGIAAAAVAIGVAELIAVLTGPQSAPIIAVGDVVVDNVPLSVKNFAVSMFGTHDKTALIIGTFILLAAVRRGDRRARGQRSAYRVRRDRAVRPDRR